MTVDLSSYVATQVVPASSSIRHNGVIIPIVRVAVEGEEYAICDPTKSKMWASEKKGGWGSGVRNTQDDPKRVERTGRLGEMAFSKITNTPIDLSYKKFGDLQDTIYRGVTTNVKVAFELYGRTMVRFEMNGKRLPLHEDLWVFAHLFSEDRVKGIAVIDFLGSLTKEDLKKGEVELRSRQDDIWKNYTHPYSALLPMWDLLNL